MTILPKSVLVVGSLADRFIADFVAHLAAANCRARVLWPVAGGETISADVLEHVRAKSLKIFYGTPANGELVKKIVDENEVDVVFHFNYETGEESALPAKIVDGARKVLATLTHFLEALRKCASPPTLVEAFFEREASQNTPRITAALGADGRLAGTFRAASPSEANFGGAVALLHSYAISYRLNIQVANFFISNASNSTDNSFDFLVEISSRQKGSAQISTLDVAPIADRRDVNDTECNAVAARFLVYGGADSEIGAAVCAHLDACGIEYAESELRADYASTDALSAEILNAAPSHLLQMPQPPKSEEDVNVYNELGAQNLLKNASENLFAPLHLAHICAKMGGVHLAYLNVHRLRSLRALLLGNDQTTNSNAADTVANKAEPTKIGKEDDDVATVVVDCFSTTKNFADATLNFFSHDNVLNAKFDVAASDADAKTQIQKCAKSLVELALAQKTGNFELA